MKRRLFSVLLLATASLAAPVEAAPSGSGSASCQRIELRVTLAPNAVAQHLVAGHLCRPRRATTTLQVLLSGATYAGVYWDFPLDRPHHSYVEAMRRSGHAVLTLDRIGTGRSSHPPAAEVTFEAQVHTTHQVVQAARRGVFGGMRFKRVVTVGHSLGSAVALVEAARHQDVDGLILTGFLAHATPVGAPELLASLQPASLEPRFKDRPAGYLTNRPRTRGDIYYHRLGARRAVIALDEATKDTVTVGELSGLSAASQRSVDEAIRVPVLSVVGEFDNVFCATSCAATSSPVFAERAHYPNAPSFETYVQPNAGHVVNLHETAPKWFAAASDWLAREDAKANAAR